MSIPSKNHFEPGDWVTVDPELMTVSHRGEPVEGVVKSIEGDEALVNCGVTVGTIPVPLHYLKMTKGWHAHKLRNWLKANDPMWDDMVSDRVVHARVARLSRKK